MIEAAPKRAEPGSSQRDNPAGEVAVRCERIRSTEAIALVRAMVIAFALGGAWFFAALLIVLPMGMRTAGTPSPNLAATLRGLMTALLRSDLTTLGASIAVIAAFVCVLPRISRRFFDEMAPKLTRKELLRRRRLRRHQRWLVACMVAAAAMGLIAAAALGAWTLAGVGLAKAVAVGGVCLIVRSVAVRGGSRLVCAGCDYPMVSWRAATDRCPECGVAWREPWRCRIGPRRTSRRMLALGVALLIASPLFVGAVALMLSA